MRQKFEAEDPAEVTENKVADSVDRSQGAARAISVCFLFLACSSIPLICRVVFH